MYKVELRLPRSFAFSRQSHEHKNTCGIQFFYLDTRGWMRIAHPPAPVLLAHCCDRYLLFSDHYGVVTLHLAHTFPSVAMSVKKGYLLRVAFLFRCHTFTIIILLSYRNGFKNIFNNTYRDLIARCGVHAAKGIWVVAELMFSLRYHQDTPKNRNEGKIPLKSLEKLARVCFCS